MYGSFLQIRNNITKSFLILFVSLSLFLFSFHSVFAANLNVEVSNTQINIGDTVTVNLYVDSQGVAINNVEGALAIPTDMLEIQSVSGSNSILSLWVEQPAYANGVVTFNGGVANPGYNGSRGKLVTIFLKAIKSGNAPISFKAASIRANDGLGTDVLENTSSPTISINTAVTPPQPILGTPNALSVTSTLTPDSDSWYNTNETTLSWTLPNGTIAVKTLLDSNPNSSPAVIYTPPIRSKEIKNLSEGVSYFHVSYQTDAGWSKITHKKIQIDNTAPEKPTLTYQKNESGVTELLISTKDTLSGVSRVVLSTPGEETIEIKTNGSDKNVTALLPENYSGKKEITVRVYDQAGNESTNLIEIVFPERVVKAPVVTAPVPQTSKSFADVITNIWNAIISWLSKFGPIIAATGLSLGVVYAVVQKLVTQYTYRQKYRNLTKIEKQTLAMVETLKQNMMEDINFFKRTEHAGDMKEAENVLLRNIIQDVRDMEKVLVAKQKRLTPEKPVDTEKIKIKVK